MISHDSAPLDGDETSPTRLYGGLCLFLLAMIGLALLMAHGMRESSEADYCEDMESSGEDGNADHPHFSPGKLLHLRQSQDEPTEHCSLRLDTK